MNAALLLLLLSWVIPQPGGSIAGGVVDAATKQPVALPGKVVTQFGGLEVTTASTNLQSLTDAVLYLVHYPFDCAEQRSSRILAIAALRDVLAAFKTKDMPTAAQMEHSVDVDIEHLSQMQNYDGGFAFWDRGYPSEPYLTVFVTNALQHAKAKGFTVEGPFPSDTVFLRARNGDFDAVLTMYHDQGQIAMKLIGFDRGVTLIGGFPFPICTPAHGTAYEIAGKGIANLGATRAALALAIRMAQDDKAKARAAA